MEGSIHCQPLAGLNPDAEFKEAAPLPFQLKPLPHSSLLKATIIAARQFRKKLTTERRRNNKNSATKLFIRSCRVLQPAFLCLDNYKINHARKDEYMRALQSGIVSLITDASALAHVPVSHTLREANSVPYFFPSPPTHKTPKQKKKFLFIWPFIC